MHYKTKQKNILIVEDDTGTTKWITLEFLKQGYNVIQADSPERAWEIITQGEELIDFAYIDVNYGNKSNQTGFMLAYQIQNNPALKIRYFIMSMDDSRNYHEQAQKVGALGFVEKKDNFLVSSLSLAIEAIYNENFDPDWGNWENDDLVFAKRIHSSTKEHKLTSKFWQSVYAS